MHDTEASGCAAAAGTGRPGEAIPLPARDGAAVPEGPGPGPTPGHAAGGRQPEPAASDRARPTARGQISRDDLLAFRGALDASTSRSIVTPLIVAACGVVFAVMTFSGVPILWPYASQLAGWGANDGARLILRHEYWRLPASVFIHGGLIHLVVNMWSLHVIGALVERIYGHLAFAVLYLASGIGGAIASAAVPPVRVSVGASGAICGILGGLLAFLVLHRRAIPPTVLRQLRRNVLMVVAFMAVLGMLVPNIDQAAHLGGLAVGFVGGLLLIGPWPVPPGPRTRRVAQRLAMTAMIAAVLAGSAVAVAHRGDDVISPARRLDDLNEQLAPIAGEYAAIRLELARSAPLFDGRDEPANQDAGRAVIRDLKARALANAARMLRVRTSHPELQAVRDALARAQAAQVDRLDALGRYLDTGDPAALAEARAALVVTLEAMRDCEGQHVRYMTRYGLIPPPEPQRRQR